MEIDTKTDTLGQQSEQEGTSSRTCGRLVAQNSHINWYLCNETQEEMQLQLQP